MGSPVTYKSFDQKAFTRAQALKYTSFGWIRSKAPIPADLKRAKNADVLMKRKLDFGMNPRINAYEKQYAKLEKKKYNKKPLLGIISFLLMLVFLLVAGIELYFGISTALNGTKTEEPASATETESTDVLGTVKNILDTVKTDYLSKITSLIDGKTDETTGEYQEGFVDSLKNMVGAPISDYINADLLVGIVVLLLSIIFIVWFAEVCKQPKKRAKNEARKEEIRQNAHEIVMDMRRQDLSLMGKTERKSFVWETIITNAIRNANATDDDDDDDDF